MVVQFFSMSAIGWTVGGLDEEKSENLEKSEKSEKNEVRKFNSELDINLLLGRWDGPQFLMGPSHRPSSKSFFEDIVFSHALHFSIVIAQVNRYLARFLD